MLKSQADYLIVEHPHLSGQIQAGLLLAVAGRVKPIGDPAAGLTRNWEVLGETYDDGKCKVYTVRDLDTLRPFDKAQENHCSGQATPRRWSCNCEQGTSYGPLTADFIGHPGRICKHIAAVGILWLECEYPERPASLWELVARLVSEQAIYLMAGESVELPTHHKVKLEYYYKNGKDGLCLKTCKARSDVLARWLPDPFDTTYSGKGSWQLAGEAEARYQEFVSRINGEAR